MTLPFETAQISPKRPGRRSFIGGSDARVIMGTDEAALLRLWREKRGEAEAEDHSKRGFFDSIDPTPTSARGLECDARRW